MVSKGREELPIETAAVLKTNFEFGRVYVHIDLLGRQFETQKTDRVPSLQQQAAIGFAESMLERSIANKTAVEQQVLHPLMAATVVGMGNVAG